MQKVSPLSVARQAVDSTIQALARRLTFASCTLEAELNDACMVFVDVICSPHHGHYQMEIDAVEVLCDKRRAATSYPCIARYIAHALDAVVAQMNTCERRCAQDHAYQQEYETVGGKFAC